ncbi:MAG: hypothetical protein A2X94_06460 [Bdellovibrionales bacterium GWB1_55_8]|nr:MAG: hypothetical protein A2X94_06460 [Bdellovibrionales bacterium GWB1_55_8]
MKNLVEYFLNHSKLVNVVSVAICLVGGLVLWDLKRDLHPPFEFELITVEAALPGASPQELETLVTFPVEETLKGIGGVKKLSSSTNEGMTAITIEYEPGTPDMDEKVEDVRQRVSKISHRLPKDLLPVQVRQMKATDVFLAVYSFKHVDPMDPSHRAALRRFQTQIEKLKGIATTELEMKNRDIYIRFKPEKLRSYGVSMSQVRGALREYFSFVPLGRLRKDEKEWAAELKQPSLDLEALRAYAIITNRTGNSVRLADLATVSWSSAEDHSAWLVDGEEVAWFEIKKDTTSDALIVYDEVKAKIESLKGSLPPGVEIVELMDGPRFIRQQLNVLKSNGVQGLVMVLVLLSLFLHWRLAIMAALGIPIAYFGSFIVLKVFGISLDLLSLIGLIVVSGVLVDDAIIISEMYSQNLEKGMKPKDAARNAVSSMMLPVTGTIITTILAFSPILIIKGSMTWFLAAIPVVISATLLFSWFESFFILPNHLTHFVTEPPKDYAKRAFGKVRELYIHILSQVVRFRYAAFAVVIGSFAGAIWIAQNKVEHYFNVGIGPEQIKIYATLKSSDSLEGTKKLMQPIFELIRAYPKDEVEYFWANLGRQWRDGRNFRGYRYVQFTLNLNRDELHPSVLKNKVLERLKKDLETHKTAGFEELSSEARKRGQDDYKKDMVSVRVEGSDAVDFSLFEKEVIAQIEKKGAIKEAVTDLYRYQEGWQFEPDALELARYRLSRYDLGTQLRQFFSPDSLVDLRHGGETIQVYTEMDRGSHTPSFNELGAFEVVSSIGTSVPLSFLGRWTLVSNFKTIDHRNGLRNLNIDFRYDKEKANLETAKKEIDERLTSIRTRYPALNITVDDANEFASENKAWSMKVVFYCMLMILGVLVLVLRSFTQPFIVALPIPLGIMGALWALYFHGQPLTLMAMIGLLGVIGIAVNDSIVMVHQINQGADKEGRLDRKAIIQGAASRLRAIFLTSTTTIAGVLPVAYGLGGESGFTQPIAFTMGYGLMSSSLMTLFLLPALLVIREDMLGWAGRVMVWLGKARRARITV